MNTVWKNITAITLITLCVLAVQSIYAGKPPQPQLPKFRLNKTQKIIPGSTVEFLSMDGKKLGSGTTNDKGTVEIKLTHRGPIQVKVSAPGVTDKALVQFTVASNSQFYDPRQHTDPKEIADTTKKYSWTYIIPNKMVFLMPPVVNDATVTCTVRTER